MTRRRRSAMGGVILRARAVSGIAALAAVLCLSASASAQPGRRGGGPGGGPAGPPPSPRAAAPIDLTGYWVAIVNEDWRWRMVTPPKGDFPGLPIGPAGRKVADAWDKSMDGRCEAYGAAGLMRMPTRLHITWEDDNTLKLETDAGQQTRRFIFDAAAKPAPMPTLQGHSAAEWERAGGGRGGRGRGGPPGARGAGPAGGPPAATGGTLKVVTTNLREGWLRRNGVPYSQSTTLTEYFDRFPAPNGDEWLVVTSVVEDPTYLTGELVTSSHFKREPDDANWSPTPCREQ